jgi:hypothetical protein
MAITFADLQGYVGKSIDDICENGFTGAQHNHCAHFASHALGIQSGLLCGTMAVHAKSRGASIRCDEIYNRIANRGAWDGRRALVDGTLLFALSARNVTRNLMQNVPQKHCGILCGGKVFNFSNLRHVVVADASIDAFHARFKALYSGGDITLFYGMLR